MMFSHLRWITLTLLAFLCVSSYAQEGTTFQFKNIQGPEDQKFTGIINDIAQDQRGYLWISSSNTLYRYDGSGYKSFSNTAHKLEPGFNDHIECMAIDSTGVIWLGYIASGLESFDPQTGKFTQYQHSKDPASLSIDTVAALLVDDKNQLWVGTHKGLDLFDRKTKTFTHYRHSPNDSSSLSDDQVRVLYMDRRKDIWVGTRSIFPNDRSFPDNGGLNMLIKDTRRFIRYMHNPHNPNTLASKEVHAIFEDSRGDFWVGTGGEGINRLDRKTGNIERFPYKPDGPGISGLRDIRINNQIGNQVTFICEDGRGVLWFGTLGTGIIRYDPATNKQENIPGVEIKETNQLLANLWRGITTSDGNVWLSTITSPYLTKVDPFEMTVPFVNLRSDGNSFYEDRNSNIWIANSNGLAKKDAKLGTMKQFFGDSIGKTDIVISFNENSVVSIRADKTENLWLGTQLSGLKKFDLRLEKVVETYIHDSANENSISSNTAGTLLFENDQTLWIGTDKGLDKLDIPKKKFTHFKYKKGDQGSLVSDNILWLALDDDGNIWIGTDAGLSRYNTKTERFQAYLHGQVVTAIFIDSEKQNWVGTDRGLFKYDAAKNEFFLFDSFRSALPLNNILNIIEDDNRNLWISAASGIFKMNKSRDSLVFFGAEKGIRLNTFLFADNLKLKSGEILFGYQDGYYQIDPDLLTVSKAKPFLHITDFQLGGKSILTSGIEILEDGSADSASLDLRYDQNIFSIDFDAIQFRNENAVSFVYKLDGYDTEWRKSSEKKAYYFNVPPGEYVFFVRAVFSDGIYSEKKLLIVIGTPWWQTWWAYALFAVTIGLLIWSIAEYRSRALRREKRILEERVKERTAVVVQQKEEITEQKNEIEKTLQELKSAQDQLVQKEKMASLGELTAGIAHEIQNPLNFVNNFAEVNDELVDELSTEITNGDVEAQQALLNELKVNNEKIAHHGKRADSIVKSMLQHSRTNAGVKEPSDINALADEYMRLSYHGLRAKDKNFNSFMDTSLDPKVGKVSIVQQELGRVLLNLFNNAFYAVAERQKKNEPGYQPRVKLSTERKENQVVIRVSDNGTGMTDIVRSKIFQPFFTTKPTGQGTGLGMSLSYDIITKGHGGELDVKSVPGEGSEFTISIPV